MTYKELFTRAYGYSTKNQPGEIATEDPELLTLAHRVYRALYTIGATIAPPFYGAETNQSGNGSGGWDHPADADIIFHLAGPGGEKVKIVPIDEQDAVPHQASVYSIGQTFKPTTSSSPDLDPSADALTIFHTSPPAAPTQVSDSTPAEFPDNHEELPILQVALYLARKDVDGREAEIQALTRERDKELARYVSVLENRLAGMHSRFSSPHQVKDLSLVSFRELLKGQITGGS